MRYLHNFERDAGIGVGVAPCAPYANRAMNRAVEASDHVLLGGSEVRDDRLAVALQSVWRPRRDVILIV